MKTYKQLTALTFTLSGYNKQSVIDAGDSYCKENEGWKIWSKTYSEFHLFKFKWEYKIDLYKPNFQIIRN